MNVSPRPVVERPSGSGKIPQDVVDAVRNGTDLVALVQRSVPLKRSGRDLIGCCPIHKESTPSLHVNPDRGWHCFGCGEKGTAVEWVQKIRGLSFRDAVLSLAADLGIRVEGEQEDPPERRPLRRRAPEPGTAVDVAATRRTAPEAPETDDEPPGPFKWTDALTGECEAALHGPDGAEVLAYLTSLRADLPGARGLSLDALREFRVGACIVRDTAGKVLERWATIPVLDAHRRPVAMRFRTVPSPCLRCNGAGCPRCASGQVKKSFRNCKGRPLPLFNVAALSGNKADSVIVTEGEFDVIALWDYGFRANVVSGTGGAGTWKEEWLDALEPYAGFYLAYDDDDPGNAGALAVAAKLGKERCSRVRFPKKDAGDCLAERVPFAEIERALDNAQDLEGIAVVRVGAIVDRLITSMSTPAVLVGVPTGSAKMDACIGGDLPGLTVVTGDSSAGKTTFTTWQMYQRARVGIPVLLTAFEDGVDGVVAKLLRMQVGGDFTRCSPAELQTARDALEAMPIYIVDHKGRLGYEDVVATLRKAVRRLGVRTAQVDHLGYVQDDSAQDQVRDITMIVKGFALLGPEIGCSIWLIAHPNNNATVQQRRVQMGDLRGAAAIRQEARVVAVVHRNEVALRGFPSVTLYFDKVRSDFGMPGSSCALAFDPMATTYADEWAQTPAGSRGSAGAGVVSPSPPPDPTKRRRRTE